MDEEEEACQEFVETNSNHQQLTSILGCYFRFCLRVDFFVTLRSVLQDWIHWFHCFCNDVETLFLEQPWRKTKFYKHVFPIYNVLGDVIKEIEYDLNVIKRQQEQGPPLPSRVDSPTPKWFRSERFEFNCLMFLQRLPELYSIMRRPIPTGEGPWEPTVPTEDIESFREIIQERQMDIGLKMVEYEITFEDQILSQLGLYKIKESIAFESIERPDPVTPEYEAQLLKTSSFRNECANLVSNFMRTNELWSEIESDLLDGLTVRETVSNYPNGVCRSIEESWSFVDRFLYMMGTVMGQTGSVRTFHYFMLYLVERFKPKEPSS